MAMQRRSSSFGTPQQEQLLKSAETFKLALEKANIPLLRSVTDFHSWKLDPDSDDTQELEGVRDPRIVAADVAAQIVRATPLYYLTMANS